MKIVVLIVTFLALFGGCNRRVEDHASQLTKIDSLESIINGNNYAIALLDQIGQYLDSIDSNIKWVVMDLETGLQEEDYIERMKNLNLYTQRAEWTIGELEKTRTAYAAQAKRLKGQLDAKSDEISILQRSIAEYQSKNEELEGLLTVSEDEIEWKRHLSILLISTK